jgi:hypothetical protein
MLVRNAMIDFDHELVKTEIIENGFSLKRRPFFEFGENANTSFSQLAQCWNHLGEDPYFGAKGHCYRVRKYSDFFFTPTTGALQRCDHVAYYQSEKMNQYVGGKVRHFADVDASVYENPFFLNLVQKDFISFPIDAEYYNQRWICQIHMIRIVVGANEETAVTPEGIHSDGYPFASVHFIGKSKHLSGGESWVYTWEEKPIISATFEEPMDTLFLEDRRMKHYVTPLKAKDKEGHRDILAVSFSLPGSPYIVDR